MLREKRHIVLLLAYALALLAVVAVAAGCGGDSGGSGGGDVALSVIGPGGTKDLTVDDLKDMQVTEGYAGLKSSTGKITPPVLVKGVLLEDLFAEVGGLPDDAAVGIVAKDGYEMTMSVSQLKSGDFITYDMVTGDENEVAGPLQVIIGYEWDGKPIDPVSEGPLRLFIISKEKNQVTDGHWSVKWVSRLQVKAIQQEWTLMLKGALAEEMDRATFESGSAQGCHGQTWIDSDGNKWTGLPLYLLVGRVDDDVKHNGPAYNRDLAEAGYQVKIKAADGKSIEVASTTMYYKKDLIVAYQLNGEALPEEYWPLRLVGEGIQPGDMIGQITEIEALVPAQ
jgi:DMSO/TMAO reductase YedYZ molybdopterin-dependent catalytic subunit